ncbi:MAG: alpha/beta fold hydrolase [Candidatus Cyclobacteriaceae bacterium M2_1C_046]
MSYKILFLFPLLFTINISFAQQQEVEICDCPYDTSTMEASKILCGKLTVPENRSRPQGRQLQIFFTVIEPENATGDPVVVLPGGPGIAPVGGPFVPRIRQWIPKDRTLIVFDPRGTGHSGPIMCPELNDTWGTIAALDLEIEEERNVKLGLALAVTNFSGRGLI